MTVERALAILERYHIKVNQPDYVIRKRGNPKSVLKAVTFLRGGSECVLCGHAGRTELHHTDGNWRNYTSDNLQYYCKVCHLLHHTLLEMHNMPKPIKYTDAVYKEIRTAVDKGVAAGKTKTEMYTKLAPKYGITALQIGKRYNNSPEKMRELGRKYTKDATSPAQRVPAVQGGVHVVSLEKAMGMLQAAQQFGVNVRVGLSFIS